MGKTNRRNRSEVTRDPGGFVALPWSVLDSTAYQELSHPARGLLMEFSRQYVRDNNGRLLCSMAYLGARGWSSNDVITRALRELVAAGFVHQTVQGHRPNKASWYAVTWQAIDRLPGYDVGTLESFSRSAYRLKQERQGNSMRRTPSPAARKNALVIPPDGAKGMAIKPSYGAVKALHTPQGGAINGAFQTSSTPSDGEHLEKPSACCSGTGCAGAGDVMEAWPIDTFTELWKLIGCRSVWRSSRASPPAAARGSTRRKTTSHPIRVAENRKAILRTLARSESSAADGNTASQPQITIEWISELDDESDREPWSDW